MSIGIPPRYAPIDGEAAVAIHQNWEDHEDLVDRAVWRVAVFVFATATGSGAAFCYVVTLCICRGRYGNVTGYLPWLVYYLCGQSML